MTRLALIAAVLVVLAGASVAWLGLRSDAPGVENSPLARIASDDIVERGRYLALLGDCQACHTMPGGAAYAGGRAIPTPFGVFYTPNITPDTETGIGRWSADDFWRALHEGRGKGGELLYPSFPYTNYTRLTRDDTDALYAYFKTLPAAAQPRREHQLKFPFGYRAMLVGWRALFFRPGVYQPQAEHDAQWNQGAYLVQGLAHCSACHEARNALGGVRSGGEPAGGLVLNWYAPALSSPAEAGVQDWSESEITALLKSGVSPRGSALGPMAEVVFESLQHARDADLLAMARYLKSLRKTAAPAADGVMAVRASEVQGMRQRGRAIYADHCASCHGEAGQGRAPAAPALAGNRALTMESGVNPVQILLYGGYTPGTAGNPRPFGMPPFGNRLSDDDIADVLTYVRQSWGNDARPIASPEVARNRRGPAW